MWETWVHFLGWEDPLEEGMATHPRTLAWRIPWTEEPGRPQSMGSQRGGHDWLTKHSTQHSRYIKKKKSLLEARMEGLRQQQAHPQCVCWKCRLRLCPITSSQDTSKWAVIPILLTVGQAAGLRNLNYVQFRLYSLVNTGYNLNNKDNVTIFLIPESNTYQKLL